jgi:hypothetical protein
MPPGLECFKCKRRPGGKFLRVRGLGWICADCRKQHRVSSRPNAPVIRGEVKPWFNWQEGKMITTRAQERELERSGPCGTLNDKEFARANLGISEGELDQAIATTRAATIDRDRRAGEKAGALAAKAAVEGKEAFPTPEVQPLGEV